MILYAAYKHIKTEVFILGYAQYITAMDEDKTLISVSKETAMKLKRIGRMCDTYDTVINKLIEEADALG